MRKVVLAIVAALSALLAAPALAADGTLSLASPAYTWEGSGMFGVQEEGALPVGLAAARCSPAYTCDNEHLEVKDAGTLTIDIKAGSGSNDLDIRLYKSDESGTAPGVQNPNEPAPEPVAQDIRTEKDARIVVKGLKPGFYVAQVASFNAQNGAYAGTATLTAPAPPAAPAPAPGTGTPAPGTTPQPPQQTSPTPAQNKADEAKRKKALAKCNKKAKKIKNKKKRKAAQKKCAKKHAKKKA